MFFVDGFFEDKISSLSSSVQAIVVVTIVYLSIKYKLRDNNDKGAKKWLDIHHKDVNHLVDAFFIFTLISLVAIFSYAPETPNDKFIVSISPLYVEGNPISDCESAEELKQKIEKFTDSRIEVRLLDGPAIIDDKEAISRGKKAGSHIVIYGTQMKEFGHSGDTIKFYIVPINFEATPPKLEVFNIDDENKFSIILSPFTPSISIADSSLTDNVSSTVYALCAFESYNKSDYVSAINMFESITNCENKDSILYYIANCYNFEGNYTEAIKKYEQVININPNNSDAWNNKGMCLFDLGKSDEAIKALDNATEVNHNNSDAWNNKGVCLFTLGKSDEAIKALDNATEVDPNNSIAWNNKGVALDNLGRSEEAIQAFEIAIQINPNYPEVWNNIGIALDNLGRSEEAIQAFEIAIQINPKYLNACYNKCTVLEKLNRSEEATQAFENSIKNNSNHINNANNYSDTPNFSNNIYNSADSNITREVSITNLNSDVNKDGIVDIIDVTLVSSHFGEITKPLSPDWDVNKDGVVDSKDINNVITVYNKHAFFYNLITHRMSNL